MQDLLLIDFKALLTETQEHLGGVTAAPQLHLWNDKFSGSGLLSAG